MLTCKTYDSSYVSEELVSIFKAKGWNCTPDNEEAKKMIVGKPPFSFILTGTFSSSEDGILCYIDRKGKMKEKPIHVLQNRPNLRVMNGTNFFFSEIEALIKHMMES